MPCATTHFVRVEDNNSLHVGRSNPLPADHRLHKYRSRWWSDNTGIRGNCYLQITIHYLAEDSLLRKVSTSFSRKNGVSQGYRRRLAASSHERKHGLRGL